MSDWHKIERELEEWARGEHWQLDRDHSNGDIIAEPAPMYVSLSSLARRLADTMTLRLVEPATKREPKA